MAYRFGNREQLGLLPASIEDYVSQEDPVRVYDGFVEKLNFTELGIEIDEDQVGNPEYDPKAMMKLLVYGYSYGVKGSRKLERECHQLANTVVLLPIVVILSHILKHLARRTDIPVFLLVVTEMTLAKGLLLFAVQCLALRRNHHLNALLVGLL